MPIRWAPRQRCCQLGAGPASRPRHRRRRCRRTAGGLDESSDGCVGTAAASNPSVCLREDIDYASVLPSPLKTALRTSRRFAFVLFFFSESHKQNARSRMPSRSLIHIQAFSERLRKSSRQQRLWQSRLTMFGQVNHGRAPTGWSREEQLHQATGSHHGGHSNAVDGDSSHRNHERYVDDQINMEDIVECYYLQEDDRMGTRCIVFALSRRSHVSGTSTGNGIRMGAAG